MINVGASASDRMLTSTVSAGSAFVARALPAATTAQGEAITGDAMDAATVDPSRTGLQGSRGRFAGRWCWSSVDHARLKKKLNNAQRARAIGVAIYTNDNPLGAWDPGAAAKLPALMISNEDGKRLKDRLAGALQVTLQFKSAPFPQNQNVISTFSSSGPTAGATIGIDMVAVGQNVYTAAERTDSRGQVFNASGYISVNGTSYSSPMVAGAAAVLKAARPGLDLIHYKSLLVNTATAFADGSNASVLRMGAGVLNVERALRAKAAVSPVSVAFGAGGGTADVTRTFQLSNLASVQDTFTITAQPMGMLTATPQVLTQTVTVPAGGSRQVSLRWAPTGLAPGGYQGFILVRGTASDIELRIPYWYAVTGSAPKFISLFRSGQAVRVASRSTFYVRVGDAAGVAMMANAPVVQAVAGEGEVLSVTPSQLFPACWLVEVKLGPVPGDNIFRVLAGEIGREYVMSAGS
ncbi:MAG: S8 family serine peptidase [Bryobacteraceae bacterium]